MTLGTMVVNSVKSLETAFVSALNKKVASAETSDNSLALNGQTATNLIDTVNSYANNHINRTDNPHGLTAAQINTYTKPEITNITKDLIPGGILPISLWGDLSDSEMVISVNASTLQVTFPDAIPVVTTGKYFTMPTQTFTLPNVTGRVLFYIYMNNGVPNYKTSNTVLVESQTNMYIGYVDVSSGSPATLTPKFEKIRRIDTIRISKTPINYNYRLVSLGAGQYTYSSAERGLWCNGVKLAEVLRSYAVYYFYAGSVVRCSTFDVYGSTAEATAMANFLNAIPNGALVAVCTYDEPNGSHLQADLVAAMKRIGATDAIFGTEFGYRNAYVLVTKVGTGSAYEAKTTGPYNDPEAVIDITFNYDGNTDTFYNFNRIR